MNMRTCPRQLGCGHYSVFILLFAVVLIAAPAGCADVASSRMGSESSRNVSSSGAIAARAAQSTEGSAGFVETSAAYQTAFQVEGPADDRPAQQKIIYEAQIALVVDDLAATESALTRLLNAADGYIAESNVAGRQGDQLSGTWRVRVPVGEFDSFLGAVAKLGVTENRQQTAQDVSEEFVDLEARLSTQQELERRIVELLDSTSDKISDVIEVEQQLARVRGEIEQMEGRLRYLTNRVALTTVTITVREERDYVPPEAPTYTAQIAQSWNGSLEALRQFGQSLGLAIVAAAPWLVVAGIVAAPVGLVFAKRRRSATRTSNVAADV